MGQDSMMVLYSFRGVVKLEINFKAPNLLIIQFRQEAPKMIRKDLLKKYHQTYQRHESLKEWICWYCGAKADTEDHIPALSIIQDFPDIPRILLRSCFSCNGILWKLEIFSLSMRIEYLINRYRDKWRKDLELPDWENVEIEELTGELKREIVKAKKRKERAIAVLQNLQKRLDMLNECVS